MSLFLSHWAGRGMRIGARVSPLFLLFLAPIWLAAGITKLILAVLQGTTQTAAGLYVQHRSRHPPAAQRALVARALVRDAVGVDAATIKEKRLVVWAVYGIGGRFFPGRYPQEEARLARLYPAEAPKITTIGFYPTASSARQVATGMRRHGFTVDELITVLGVEDDEEASEQPDVSELGSAAAGHQDGLLTMATPAGEAEVQRA